MLGLGLAAGGLARKAAAAEDGALLQALIQQNQRRELGQDFDAASRTIHMPKASLPTLSPGTVETTRAGGRQIPGHRGAAAAGPRCRPPTGCASATAIRAWCRLRKRLIVAGDLEANAGATDIFDSYVEAAVRRFQARHGITIDGIVRKATFDRLNVPADVRLAPAQDQCRRG